MSKFMRQKMSDRLVSRCEGGIVVMMMCHDAFARGYSPAAARAAVINLSLGSARGLSQQNIAVFNCVVVQFVMGGIYESDWTVSGEFANFPELQIAVCP